MNPDNTNGSKNDSVKTDEEVESQDNANTVDQSISNERYHNDVDGDDDEEIYFDEEIPIIEKNNKTEELEEDIYDKDETNSERSSNSLTNVNKPFSKSNKTDAKNKKVKKSLSKNDMSDNSKDSKKPNKQNLSSKLTNVFQKKTKTPNIDCSTTNEKVPYDGRKDKIMNSLDNNDPLNETYDDESGDERETDQKVSHEKSSGKENSILVSQKKSKGASKLLSKTKHKKSANVKRVSFNTNMRTKFLQLKKISKLQSKQKKYDMYDDDNKEDDLCESENDQEVYDDESGVNQTKEVNKKSSMDSHKKDKETETTVKQPVVKKDSIANNLKANFQKMKGILKTKNEQAESNVAEIYDSDLDKDNDEQNDNEGNAINTKDKRERSPLRPLNFNEIYDDDETKDHYNGDDFKGSLKKDSLFGARKETKGKNSKSNSSLKYMDFKYLKKTFISFHRKNNAHKVKNDLKPKAEQKKSETWEGKDSDLNVSQTNRDEVYEDENIVLENAYDQEEQSCVKDERSDHGTLEIEDGNNNVHPIHLPSSFEREIQDRHPQSGQQQPNDQDMKSVSSISEIYDDEELIENNETEFSNQQKEITDDNAVKNNATFKDSSTDITKNGKVNLRHNDGASGGEKLSTGHLCYLGNDLDTDRGIKDIKRGPNIPTNKDNHKLFKIQLNQKLSLKQYTENIMRSGNTASDEMYIDNEDIVPIKDNSGQKSVTGNSKCKKVKESQNKSVKDGAMIHDNDKKPKKIKPKTCFFQGKAKSKFCKMKEIKGKENDMYDNDYAINENNDEIDDDHEDFDQLDEDLSVNSTKLCTEIYDKDSLDTKTSSCSITEKVLGKSKKAEKLTKKMSNKSDKDVKCEHGKKTLITTIKERIRHPKLLVGKKHQSPSCNSEKLEKKQFLISKDDIDDAFLPEGDDIYDLDGDVDYEVKKNDPIMMSSPIDSCKEKRLNSDFNEKVKEKSELIKTNKAKIPSDKSGKKSLPNDIDSKRKEFIEHAKNEQPENRNENKTNKMPIELIKTNKEKVPIDKSENKNLKNDMESKKKALVEHEKNEPPENRNENKTTKMPIERTDHLNKVNNKNSHPVPNHLMTVNENHSSIENQTNQTNSVDELTLQFIQKQIELLTIQKQLLERQIHQKSETDSQNPNSDRSTIKNENVNKECASRNLRRDSENDQAEKVKRIIETDILNFDAINPNHFLPNKEKASTNQNRESKKLSHKNETEKLENGDCDIIENNKESLPLKSQGDSNTSEKFHSNSPEDFYESITDRD